LEHKGRRFQAVRKQLDGRTYYEPVEGWNELSACTNQDSESLCDELDEACYNCEYLIEEK
jgi:hypothetical protein